MFLTKLEEEDEEVDESEDSSSERKLCDMKDKKLLLKDN